MVSLKGSDMGIGYLGDLVRVYFLEELTAKQHVSRVLELTSRDVELR